MWPQIFTAVFSIIDKVFPNPQDAIAAKLEAMKLQDSAEGRQLEAATKLQLAQIEVNNTEAKSESLFKSGWRPFTAWSAAIGLMMVTVWAPLIAWAIQAITGRTLPPLPTMQTETLVGILTALLGIGTMRTVEKSKGVN